MKIELQPNINYYTAPVKTVRPQGTEISGNQKSLGNFDGITIQAAQSPSQEEMFASSVSSRLSMELRKPVTETQISDLQQQIDKGIYQIDINTIADRIMLY